MNHTEIQHSELIRFIDGWLEENEWRLDQPTLDFALDVRLLAAARPAKNDLQPAA
jgi:hypothetical protein